MDTPVARLRGHHLFCLLAFSGDGYSDAFNERFARLADIYRRPDSLIEVVISADDACAACPHGSPDGCKSAIDGPEQSVKELDQAVLDLLGIEPGIHRASDLHKRLAAASNKDVHATCKACSWYGRTNCQDLIARFVAG
jgi:uncharacterized protein